MWKMPLAPLRLRSLVSVIVKFERHRAARCFRTVPLIFVSVLLWLTPVNARKHQHWGEGLSVDVDAPYEQVAKIVEQVSGDGIIRGTSQYRGTTELEGATASKIVPGFERWNGKGAVLYKMRPDTLSPEHFYQSGDQGTVVVRYIVEPAGANLTNLRIEARFEENDRHRLHPSDGQVENSEFAEISQKLKDLADQEQKQGEEAAAKQEKTRIEELRAELERDITELTALTAKQEQLEKQLKDLQGGASARIRSAGADLKAAPYNQSKTLRLLSPGEAATVLFRTQNWCQVQTGNGDMGWVYRLMLEVVQ